MRKSGIIDEVEGCSIFWSKEKRATNLFKQALQRKLSQMGSANFAESKNLSTTTDTFY